MNQGEALSRKNPVHVKAPSDSAMGICPLRYNLRLYSIPAMFIKDPHE